MFFLSHPKRNNTQIRVHVYLPRVKAPYKYNTKRSVDPKDWDSKKGRPKALRGEGAKRNRNLNLILDEYVLAVQRIKDLYGQSLTAQILKDKLDEYFHIKEEIKVNTTVDHNFKTYLLEIETLGSLTKESVESYKKIFKKFLSFEDGKILELMDLDNDFFVDFIVFLREEYKLSDNTLYRQMNFFKTFLNWCNTKSMQTNKDYKKVKLNKYNPDTISLTKEDLKVLENLELSKSKSYHRDLFLIGCYSGQRFSDYSVFERSDVQGNMIIKRSEKTESHSFIPLIPQLKSLLDKHDWNLTIISGQKFNDYLKIICQKAGFDEEVKTTKYMGSKKTVEIKKRWEIITSHTARRTFITIASENLMPDHIIMKITGIQDPKTLQRYKKVNKEKVMDYALNVFS